MTIPVGAEQRERRFAAVDLSLIGDSNLGALDLRVAIAIAAHLDGRTRRGQVSGDTIATVVQTTRAKVSSAVCKLERLGHLSVGRQRVEGGRYLANRYRMSAPKGSTAYVPLAWALRSKLNRHGLGLKALIFCSKLADKDGLFLANAKPLPGDPRNRVHQFADAAGIDPRTAARGLRTLVEIGALTWGWTQLEADPDGSVRVDRGKIDPATFQEDWAAVDNAGNIIAFNLSRPEFQWPITSPSKATPATGYMAGILGVHGRRSRGTRQAPSGNMESSPEGQNQPRSFSTGLPAPGISASGCHPMADASISNGGRGASTPQNSNEAGEPTMELLSKALVVKAKPSPG